MVWAVPAQRHPPPIDTLTLQELCLGPTILPGRSFAVRFPNKVKIRDVQADCRTDLIAWLLTYEYVSPFDQMMHRLLPSHPIHSRRVVGLWISRMDGMSMREIGHMQQGEEDAEEGPESLEWLHDGKQVSFLYKYALYTVPVQ